MKTKHGVWYVSGHDVKYLAEQALKHYYSHIWIMPGCAVSLAGSGGEYSIKTYYRDEKPATVSAWKRGVGHVSLIFLEHTAWVQDNGPFSGINPKELNEAINEIESTLGVPVTGSPAGMGWGLLKKLHPEWIENISVNLRDLHFNASSGPDIICQRTPADDEGIHIVKLDRGAAYPAASTQTDFGKGTPFHVEGSEAVRTATHEKGNPQAVGVWNCHVTSMSIDTHLPYKHIPSGTYWLSGPRIRMLESIGYSVEPLEGWVFPERHDLLVKWANLLWNARVNAKSPWAKKAYKLIANATIGFTAYKDFPDFEEEKRRPDIRLQVVSRNAEIMHHNIDKVWKSQQKSPVIVYMDALYYLTDSEDGRAAFPELMGREGKLGGYKYEGSIKVHEVFSYTFKGDNAPAPFSGTIMALLQSKRYTEGNKLEVLNAKGWVK